MFLWTWTEIENRLSELDEVTQDRVLRGDTSRSAPAICRVLSGAMVDYLDRPLYSSASVLDGELEAAKTAIDQHLLEVAEHQLDQIETRSADKLQAQQWYQLKALKSRIYIDRGEWPKAGRLLLDATRFQPATERAQINEALGYELLGERVKAHGLATDLRGKYPHSAKLIAVWLRTVPASTPISSCEETATPFLKDCVEVNMAMAHLALVAADETKAEGFARRATEIESDLPHGWYLFGLTVHTRGYKAPKCDREPLLRQAESHYDRAIQLAHSRKMSDLEAASRLNRGRVRWLLDDPRSEADYAAAVELGLPDRGYRTDYAGYLVEMNRLDAALRELSSIPGPPDGKRLFLEAFTRYGRNQCDDRAKAEELLLRIVTCGPAEAWEDAHILLVKWSTEAKSPSSAETALAGSKLADVNPLLFHTLMGWLAVSKGDSSTTDVILNSAKQAVTDTSDLDHLFLLAQVFMLKGNDEQALPLLERCVRRGIFNAECRKLVTVHAPGRSEGGS